MAARSRTAASEVARLAGRGETTHGLREHGERASHVEATEKTGAFLPLRDSLAMRPRYLAARVTSHRGLLANQVPAQTRRSRHLRREVRSTYLPTG